MSYGQYNEPVRYQPPPLQEPRKSNIKPWLIGCGSCVAIICALIAWMVLSVSRAIDEFRPEVREAKMLSGEQLAWRELPYHPRNMIVVGVHMRAMHLDSDGERELLFLDTAEGRLEVVDIDGNLLEVHQWDGELDNANLEIWDFDGDGRDELLYSDEDGSSPGTTVADLDRRFVHKFDDLLLPDWRATADVDGDGDEELLLRTTDWKNLQLVNQGGAVLIKGRDSVDDPTMGYHQPPILADPDGDGTWSVLYGDFDHKRVQHADGSTESLRIPDDPLLTMGQVYELALDIDGDGRTELINAYIEVFLDPATGHHHELRNPLDDGMRLDWLYRIPIVSFDPEDDGEAALWTVPGAETGTELVAFGSLGNVVYHEAMEKFCGGLEVIERKGVKHLVVCAFDKVLVYP